MHVTVRACVRTCVCLQVQAGDDGGAAATQSAPNPAGIQRADGKPNDKYYMYSGSDMELATDEEQEKEAHVQVRARPRARTPRLG